jgi:AcrR family transcriptional regulator
MSITKAAQSESTRSELIAAGRRLFTERGYAATSTEEIVREAGVTRGALYYHFKDKRALFEAVFEYLEGSLGPKMAAVVRPGRDAWETFFNGCNAFLDISQERDIQQIVLIDGPSVLGWETWRAIEARYGLAPVAAGLRAAMDGGFIGKQPVEPLAQLVLAAINEAALAIARADDPKAARREVGDALGRLLAGLRTAR